MSAPWVNAGGSVRAGVIDELAAPESDRMDTIAGRAEGLKLMMEIASWSESLPENVQQLCRHIGREADVIYALAIQPRDGWRTKQ